MKKALNLLNLQLLSVFKECCGLGSEDSVVLKDQNIFSLTEYFPLEHR